MKLIVISTLMMSFGLSACAASRAGEQVGSGKCDAEAAARLVGEVAPNDDTILLRTGSTIVRRIAPGDQVTQDYRLERVTVSIAEGRVISASCG
jgi:hypothetical protein